MTFDKVVKVVEKVKGEQWDSFVDRHGDQGRDMAFYLARKRCGLTLAQIGEEAGGVDPRTVGQAVSRFGKRMKRNRRLARIASRCLNDLSNIKM